MMRVLLIEDNEGDVELTRAMLPSVDVQWAPSLDAGVNLLNDGGFDAVLLDLSLPDSQGIDSVSTAHLFDSETPIIVLTGLDDEDSAMAAIAAGAHDYLVKDKTDEASLQRSIKFAKQRLEVQQALPPQEAGVEARIHALVCPTGPAFHDAVANTARSLLLRAPVLYVGADRPAAVMQRRFAERGVPAGDIHFIDTSGSPPGDEGHIHVVDDALDLSELALEIERACAALGHGTHVMVDSVNAIMLHHGLEMASVFCHTLANRLRLLGISAHLIAHDNQEWPFLSDRLSFLDGAITYADGESTEDPAVA